MTATPEALLVGWAEVDTGTGSKRMTAADALRRLADHPERYQTLRAVLLGSSPSHRCNQMPSARSLGRLLASYLDQPTPDGLCLRGKTNGNGITEWWVDAPGKGAQHP